MTKGMKYLLPHEKELIKSGGLIDTTHPRSSSVWLTSPSSNVESGKINVYRVMGDVELIYFLEHKTLPNTQAYQSIQKEEIGRLYAEKYLKGHKWVSTNPTTVIEFNSPKQLIDCLFEKQSKVEDGCMSTGLGYKAGNTLDLFNESLRNNETTWKIVTVKRKCKK
jgi:hypothetical protein